MEKRKLGNTGVELSIVGFGGFHLIEIGSSEASYLLNTYLDRGGNYVETAASYGDGNSERKIGMAISSRREEYLLATKCGVRDAKGAEETVNRSLKNLKTDHLDVLFMHGVQTPAMLEQVLGPGGEIEAAEKMKKAGKVRFIAISGHGRQPVLEEAVKRYPFDILMTGFNYFDRFNFPSTEGSLIDTCRDRGVGLLGMKAVADGYLYRSWEQAIRYTLSLPIASLVLGMNSREMLEKDLRLAESFTPITDEAREKIFKTAPELGDYVCRLCGKCRVNGFDPEAIFLLEGLYDRQMDDRRVDDTAQFALRERLKFWFNQAEEAKNEYAALATRVDPDHDYSKLNELCPYGIDIDRKLKIAHDKLSANDYIY
ncbi:MAG TPA: aldo/keto reductase [Spirochaetia bacterium]|nr:aldo/keto reductase [Spirochaetia bacterium]